MSESLSASERGDVPLGRRPRSGGHGVGFVAGASWAVPPPPPSWCLVVRFTCRHSARVFSSPALHACFAARPPHGCRGARRAAPCLASARTPARRQRASRWQPTRPCLAENFVACCSPLVQRSFSRQTVEQEVPRRANGPGAPASASTAAHAQSNCATHAEHHHIELPRRPGPHRRRVSHRVDRTAPFIANFILPSPRLPAPRWISARRDLQPGRRAPRSSRRNSG